MAEQMAERGPSAGQSSASRAESSGRWVEGFVVFAGVMMIILGVFHAVAGLAAIVRNTFYVVTPNYLYAFDVGVWGWIHLILGVVVAAAGFAVFSGRLWARAVGIVLAGLSAVANFLFIPYYPFWSLLMIALSVFVIWALAVHGREAADKGPATVSR